MGYSATQQPVKTNGRIDLYVAGDAVGASDQNQGTTPTTPLKTLNEAIRRCNVYDEISAIFVIHVAPAPVAGYAWTTPIGAHIMRERIVITGDGAGQGGDGFTALLGSTVAQAGSSNVQVVAPAGLGVNTYRGEVIEILTGAAAGDRRTIRDHTDTTIIPSRNFTAAVAANDTFRIVTPTATLTISGGAAVNLVLGSGLGTGSTQASNNPPALNPYVELINFNYSVAASTPLRTMSAGVVMLGGKFTIGSSQQAVFLGDDSSLYLGCEWPAGQAGVPVGNTYFGAPSSNSWSGWGCYFPTGVSFGPNTLGGFWVSGTGATISNTSFFGQTMLWLGGSSSIANGVTAFLVALGSAVRISIGSLTGIAPQVVLSNTGGTNAALDIDAGGNVATVVQLYLRRALLSAPVLLRTRGPTFVSLGSSTDCSGAGTTLGIDCRAASQVACAGVTGLLGPSGADLSVDSGVSSIAAGDLAADGEALTNQVTGASIVRIL